MIKRRSVQGRWLLAISCIGIYMLARSSVIKAVSHSVSSHEPRRGVRQPPDPFAVAHTIVRDGTKHLDFVLMSLSEISRSMQSTMIFLLGRSSCKTAKNVADQVRMGKYLNQRDESFPVGPLIFIQAGRSKLRIPFGVSGA